MLIRYETEDSWEQKLIANAANYYDVLDQLHNMVRSHLKHDTLLSMEDVYEVINLADLGE